MDLVGDDAHVRCSYHLLPNANASDVFRRNCATQKIADDVTDLLAQMLTLDPSGRPTAEQCLDHAWFQNAPAAMSSAEFQAATARIESSHEFVVKGKGAKRARADGEPPGALPFAAASCLGAPRGKRA